MNESDKTKEQLIEELKLLRTLIDALPDRLYVKDAKGRFVICNKAVSEDADLPFSEGPVGKTDFDLFSAEEAAAFYAGEQEIIRTGNPIVNEELHRIQRKDGRENWSLCTKLPWRDKNGNIIGIIGANREITELKNAEKAFRESEARYKAIFETAKEGILVADVETKQFKYANPAICKMLGYTAEELIRMSINDIHSKEHLQHVLSAFHAQVRGESDSSCNIICLRKDGTTFYADIHTTNVVIDQRLCNVGFFTDVTRHKHDEEALCESEQKYRLLVEQLPAITYTAALDEMSTTLYTSPQVQDILGVSQADYKADPDLWRKLLHPDDRDRVMMELALAHQTGELFSYEYRMLKKDGRVVWIRDEARIVRDDKGKALYLQGVMYDITANKQAEEALRQSEEKFRGLAERSFDMVFTTDTRGFITYLSPASGRIFAYKPEEMAGKHFSTFLVESEIPKATQRFIEKLKGARLGSLHLEAKKKDGSSVFIELNSALIIQDGVVQGTQGIIRDVTERKKAEEQLQKAQEELETRVQQRTADLARAIEELQNEIAEREQAEESLRRAEERFRTVFENTIVGLYRTTPDGRILLANPALIEMMGCKSFEELARLNLEKEGFDPSMPRSIFKQRIEKEGRVIGFETVWLRPDGSKLFVSESAFAVRDGDGNILYYEGTAQDISKRKEAEEKLMLYQEQLRSLASELSLAEERLRRRIATELHDNIAQNLAVSKVKLEALADPANPGLVKSLGEVINLVAQTIDATRSLTFEMSPPVLYELGFEAAVGWLAKQTRQRFGLDVEFSDDEKAKPLDIDVRVLLFQAVRELLVNVVKHAGTGRAKVSVHRGRGRILVTVEDDGVGFDVSSIGISDYSKGGFGLFNIRERLSHIGGGVEISSKPGHGTRVTLTAPIDDQNKKKKTRSGAKK